VVRSVRAGVRTRGVMTVMFITCVCCTTQLDGIRWRVDGSYDVIVIDRAAMSETRWRKSREERVGSRFSDTKGSGNDTEESSRSCKDSGRRSAFRRGHIIYKLFYYVYLV
jgi:hypothetical protein